MTNNSLRDYLITATTTRNFNLLFETGHVASILLTASMRWTKSKVVGTLVCKTKIWKF